MAFCPRCRTEYVSGPSHCSDCGAELVESLPEVSPADVHWVELVSAGTEPEGELVKELLEERGIPVMIKKDVFSSGFGRQGTSIWVPSDRREEARACAEEAGAF